MSRLARGRAALLLAAALSGCARERPLVHANLAALAPLAEHELPVQLVLFGAPASEPFLGSGFNRPPVFAGDPYLWSRREADLVLRWPEVRPRDVVLDVAPYPGVTGQTLELRLNGAAVARFEVAPERRRYLASIPAEAQTRGENRLGLAFGKIAPTPTAQGRRIAALVYSVAVGPSGAPALADLLARGAPPPLSVEAPGGVPRLLQAGPGAVRFSFRLPRGAELRVTPRLHPTAAAAGAAVRLAVTLQGLGGAPREIWSRVIGPADPAAEAAVRLEGEPGSLVRLGLEVKGAAGERFAWAVWEAPRVLAPGPPESPRPPPAAEQPKAAALRSALAGSNVLLLVLDAARAQSFGCYGYSRNTTPEIDRIAREGVVFERAYAPAVYTLAAMGSVWTSLHPDEHGAGVVHGARLPPGPLTLAELLGARGVLTAGFVANGMAGPAFGFSRGFSEFVEVFRGNTHDADVFREKLPPWLAKNASRRFFAYAHVREPHFPYDPRAPFDSMFGEIRALPREARRAESFTVKVNWGGGTLTPEQREDLVRLYDGNLAFADHEIGALRRTLEELGLWQKTVVIVTADHGEALYEHGLIGHNQQLYEESVHIPLIVRFPAGKGPAGVRVSSLVDSLDIGPTIADVFGLLAEARGFRGRSLLPVAFGAPGRRHLFSRSTGDKPRYSVRDERYKLIYSSKYGQEELYDVAADPREQDDRSTQDPVRTAYYRQVLFEWLQGLRRGGEEEAKTPELTPEQRENLRALGYVN